MTIGIGGSTPEQELVKLTNMTEGVQPISLTEYKARIEKAQSVMKKLGLKACFMNAGTNLYYFTGMRWGKSERIMGVIIPAEGEAEFIGPAFEEGTINGFMNYPGKLNCWEEDECPYQLFGSVLKRMGAEKGEVGIDDSTGVFIYDAIAKANPAYDFINGGEVSNECRMYKSPAEIALLQRAKDMTMVVQKAVARILKPGITADEVTYFIDQAHKKLGAPRGSSFCIVLFGPDSAFPHGVNHPKPLEKNDMVLIDTGCLIEGYNSDITRSYVFGEPSERQRTVWNTEKLAQVAAFEAAQLGRTCGEVDEAARSCLEAIGFGPDYQLPGMPHRTGHGVGLDIHETPYIVRKNNQKLAVGMCFSNEPMICVPGEFGVRLEDHMYISEDGPRWFSEPSWSIDDPFGYNA